MTFPICKIVETSFNNDRLLRTSLTVMIKFDQDMAIITGLKQLSIQRIVCYLFRHPTAKTIQHEKKN